jgi:uncharacterized protein (TIRG00374 family)
MPDPVSKSVGANKKRLILLFAGALGVSLLLAAYSGISDFTAAIRSFDPMYLPLILIMAPLNYILRFVKWSYYLKIIGVELRRRDSALIFLSGLAMTATPGKVGELLKSYMIKEKYGVPISYTASMIVAERATDGISMLVLAFLGSSGTRYGINALAAIAVLTCAGVALIQNKRIFSRVLDIISRVRFLKKTASSLENMYRSSFELFRPVPLLLAVVIGVVSWSFEGLIIYLSLMAFGAPAGIAESIFAVAFSSIIGAASMLPGGLFAAEVSIVGILTQLSVPAAIASGTAIVSRFSTLWLGVLIGLTAMFLSSKYGFFK